MDVIKELTKNAVSFKQRKPFLSSVIMYMALFIPVFAALLSGFLRSDKMFLGLGDGPQQLYPALYHAGAWLKQIVSNFAHGIFAIPTWSWNIGVGADVITTLHCNVIGDPFTIFALFWPQSKMEELFYLLVTLKMYCMGIAFIKYALYMKFSTYQSLIGGILYTFSGFVVVYFVPMIIFGTPIVYLPLLLMGLEKIFRKEKPHMFVFMVALSALNSFYFFYMLAMITVIYAVIRYIFTYRTTVKAFFATFSKIAGLAITGVLMSAVIFFPVVYAAMGSSRAEGMAFSDVPFLYRGSFYKDFILGFLTPAVEPGNYTLLGVCAVTLFALILLFTTRNKKLNGLRALFLVFSVIMLLPIGGWISNGGAYPSNRWMFGYVFVLCIITCVFLPKLKDLSNKHMAVIGGFLLLYLVFCIKESRSSIYPFVALFFAALLLAAVAVTKSYKSTYPLKASVIFLTVVYLAFSVHTFYSGGFLDKAGSYTAYGETTDIYKNNTGSALSKVDDQSFFRVSALGQPNASSVLGFHGDSSYWSIQGASMFDLYKDQNIGLRFIHNYPSFCNDVFLSTLIGTKYSFIYDWEENSLFGYEKTNIEDEGIDIYENQYALPLGFTYENTMAYSEYEKLETIDKKRALLNTLVLGDAERYNQTEKLTPLDYSIKQTETVKTMENKIIAEENEAKSYIEVELPANHVIYVGFKNLNAEKSSLFRFDSGEAWASFNYLDPGNLYYYDNHDFMICLGSSDVERDRINFQLEMAETYTFDELSVYAVPMDEYIKDAEDRAADKWDRLTAKDNDVKGDMTVDKDKMLFFSIPYDKGWSATVNGKQADIVKANVAFMAIPIKAGENHIELHYDTPLLSVGACVSLATVLVYIAVCIVIKRKKPKRYEFKD